VAGKKKTSTVPVASARIPSFGQSPVRRPDAAGYAELAARISAHVKPADPIEELYTRDIIDLTLELLNYRRNKELILESAVPRALEEKLAPLINGRHRFDSLPRYGADGALEPSPAMELVNDWVKHEPKALARVDEILASAKLTMEDVRAHALLLRLGVVEQLDRLITSVEARRNGVLREIERYRALLPHALREAANETEEGGFEVVTHGNPAPEVSEH
jgi:hypothetical protein